MKNIVIILTLIFISCNTTKSSESDNSLSDKDSLMIEVVKNNTSKDYNSVKYSELRPKTDIISKCDSLVELVDSVNLDSIRIIVLKISESYYDSIASINTSLKFENIYSNKHKEHIDTNAFRINDSTIIYRLNDNSFDTLSDYYSSGLGFSKYKYCRFIEPLNSYLFACQYYEARGTMIINKKTGIKKNLSHHIVISPDNRFMLTYAWDGWAYHSGGFDLYEIDTDSINLKVRYHPPEYIYEKKGFYWSFSDIYIMDEFNFIFKHQYYLIKGNEMINCYSKLEMLE